MGNLACGFCTRESQGKLWEACKRGHPAGSLGCEQLSVLCKPQLRSPIFMSEFTVLVKYNLK